jgi:beta-lactamase class A
MSRRGPAITLVIVGLVIEVFSGMTIARLDAAAQQARNEARLAAYLATLPVTAADPAGEAFANQQLAPDSLFRAYFDAHAGTTTLGPALTPALPLPGGWLQFYTDGALFKPGASPAAEGALPLDVRADQSALTQLVVNGAVDGASGVVRLPLLQALVSAGSQVAIGATGSQLTYADLRRAAQPDRLQPTPTGHGKPIATATGGVFVATATQSGKAMGHVVPASFSHALADPSMAPDGWQADFGNPLTAVLTATIWRDGQQRTLSVQMFQRNALLLDQATDAPAAGAASSPQLLPVGLDYLRTFGPPAVRLASGTAAWTAAAMTLRAQADDASASVAHVGPNFPLTLAPVTQWVNATLWYEGTWKTPHAQAAGWLNATAVMAAAPSGGAWAEFDALDPTLAGYLASQGQHVGAVVYDVTRGITYQYNADKGFIVASSVKVPIMLALLTQIEDQGREPSDDEMKLLTAMIENSDNDSAQLLYEEIGDAPGLTAFMQRVGVSGLTASSGTWGWSTITPAAMAQLLALLDAGNVLTAEHRALALNLMESVESDQQIGVGTTAPAGAMVAMKDGWVGGPDGLWVMNSSGIVSAGSEKYIISVFTDDDDALDQGWSITEHVCGAVASLIV